MQLPRNRRVLAGAISLALAGGSALGIGTGTGVAQAAGPKVTLAVPAYFIDDALWEKMIAIPEVGYIIGHPEPVVDGEEYVADKALADHLNQAKAKGKKTLVYVTGGYEKIDWKVVAKRIDTVLAAYPQADGVFIDEITYNQCSKYSSLTKGAGTVQGLRARHPGKMLVLNPGGPIWNCYQGLADGFVNLERAESAIPAWTQNVTLKANVPYYSWMFTAANRPYMWQMVHSINPANAATAVDAALARNASVLYLTNDVMANPYDSLPSDAVLNAITARIGAVQLWSRRPSPGSPARCEDHREDDEEEVSAGADRPDRRVRRLH